ncbi:MAG: Fe-S cluster assembly protein SufD [Proteobacteria bacterium]|nr:Fe-S cluster assembly protein SufD [Pseudomonadota bacterium]
MTDINSIHDSYSALKARLSPLAPSALMRRDIAVSRAAQLGYPTTRHEDWKYSSLRPLLEKCFRVPTKFSNSDDATYDYKELNRLLIPDAIKLVFVDGELSIALSDTRKAGDVVSIKALFEAEGHDESYWKDLDALPGAKQVFSQIAVGFADHGVMVKVSARISSSPVIHLLHVMTDASKGFSRSTRNVIEVQRLSQVRIYEEFVTLGVAPYHHNSLTQIIAREGSNIGYYRMDQSGPEAFLTGQVTVTLDRDAKVETFSLASGGKFCRTNIDAAFAGSGGECILDGLYLLRGEQHSDHHTSIDHAVPQCLSRQLYKGILAGKSRGVFNGKIMIRRGASESQAFQSNKNLLLSLDAEIDTKPELLIDNNDVKASHGAAIGAIDPKELFYLQSRSIGRAEAEAILSRGFADEVVLRVEDNVAQSVLASRVAVWFATHQVEV